MRDRAVSGIEAFWGKASKEVACLACGPQDAAPTAGAPGASAAAEGERRRKRRVDQARRPYGDHAAAVAEKMAERHRHALSKRLKKAGDLSRDRIERIAYRLQLSLPNAGK
jgi:hypothetical protein